MVVLIRMGCSPARCLSIGPMSNDQASGEPTSKKVGDSWPRLLAPFVAILLAGLLVNFILVKTAIHTQGTITSVERNISCHDPGFAWDYTISYSVDGKSYTFGVSCIHTQLSQNGTVPVLVRPLNHASAAVPGSIDKWITVITYPFRTAAILFGLLVVGIIIISVFQTIFKRGVSKPQSPPGPASGPPAIT